MRGDSSKQFNGVMEVEKPKQQDESHLSGAYIRSLVKQLSSSRSNPDSHPPTAKTAALEVAKDTQQQKQRPPGSPESPSPSSSRPQKKQVRRRLHTTRPYQERLFNMAEARREIVAALKLHRAAMKQQKQRQEQESGAMDAAPALQPNYSFPTPLPSLDLLPWSCPPISPLSPSDRLNFFHLPDHPLGLNLDLQSFQNIDSTSIYSNQEPSSPPASSLSCSNTSPRAAAARSSGQQTSRAPPAHPAVDDEEMAEIQSIGEHHEMEWNDRTNSATSAWWSTFLKSMEEGGDGGVNGGDGLRFFNEFLDSTSVALTESNNSMKQQHLDEYFRVEDYLESFDNGEIEYR